MKGKHRFFDPNQISPLKPIKRQKVYLNTFGNENDQKQVVKLKLKGRSNGHQNEVEIKALNVRRICTPFPASIDISKVPHLEGYELVDEYTETANYTKN